MASLLSTQAVCRVADTLERWHGSSDAPFANLILPLASSLSDASARVRSWYSYRAQIRVSYPPC